MSTAYLAPTTELEAVNEMLATIGEAPVGTLTGSLPIDASTALQRLRERSRALQASGWSFNTDEGMSLAAQEDGRVPLPRNALKADFPDNPDYVVRGGFVYDTSNHTFTIGTNVTADIVRFLPFDDLPEYARQFIMIAAARRFQDKMLGDEGLHSFTLQDERQAWASFHDAEADIADLNVLSGSTSVQRIIRKRRS